MVNSDEIEANKDEMREAVLNARLLKPLCVKRNRSTIRIGEDRKTFDEFRSSITER